MLNPSFLFKLRYHFISIRYSDNRFLIRHSKSSLSLTFATTTSGIPVLDIAALLTVEFLFASRLDIQIVD